MKKRKPWSSSVTCSRSHSLWVAMPGLLESCLTLGPVLWALFIFTTPRPVQPLCCGRCLTSASLDFLLLPWRWQMKHSCGCRSFLSLIILLLGIFRRCPCSFHSLENRELCCWINNTAQLASFDTALCSVCMIARGRYSTYTFGIKSAGQELLSHYPRENGQWNLESEGWWSWPSWGSSQVDLCYSLWQLSFLPGAKKL